MQTTTPTGHTYRSRAPALHRTEVAHASAGSQRQLSPFEAELADFLDHYAA